MLSCLVYENDSRLMRHAEALAARGDTVEVLALKRDSRQPNVGMVGRVRVYRIQCRPHKNQRTKMAHLKEGHAVHDVMVQEGVYTFETWGAKNAVAEPVVYMIDRYVIGGFYRVHTDRRPDENLNAPGMQFVPLAFASSCCLPDQRAHPTAAPNRFYMYGVIGRLAALAASIELERTDPDQDRLYGGT